MRMRRCPLLLIAVTASLWGQTPAPAVTFDRILRANDEPQNWLTYAGTYSSQRHSKLTQITPDNVSRLELQWVYQVATREPSSTKFEATPLVVDGVMYTVRPPNDVVALDAASGRVLWIKAYTPADQARLCCGRVNRGVAILGDTLFMGTIDGRLLALDAKDGRTVWDVAVARPEAGYAITHAPLVVRNMVIVGPAGAEYGIRGFLAAFDAKTGKELWRFDTVPGPGEPGVESWSGESWKTGGGSIWMTGSYDPETNLTYWGTGNPAAVWNGDSRAGDNLYTDSVVAIDAATGKLTWHFQFTPHDEFDYDAAQAPVLADIEWQGRSRKVMLWANKNGYFYVLDRTTGEFLLGKPFVNVTWASGLNARGRPIPGFTSQPGESTVPIAPGVGGTNWHPPSFSPATGLFYVPAFADRKNIFLKEAATYVEGQRFSGGTPRPTDQRGYSAVRAILPATGAMVWEFKIIEGMPTTSGVLTTASNLLFTGGRGGDFYALDARSGARLWKTTTGAPTDMAPMTYAVKGRQYVAVTAGSALFTFALRQ